MKDNKVYKVVDSKGEPLYCDYNRPMKNGEPRSNFMQALSLAMHYRSFNEKAFVKSYNYDLWQTGYITKTKQ
jgi:hypothetical protein